MRGLVALWSKRTSLPISSCCLICGTLPCKRKAIAGVAGMVVRRRGATWCLWSAALAAVPYFRASLDAPPMVVALGQAGDVPVAVALLAVLVWGVVRSGCDESRPAYVIRRIVEPAGLAATAALVVVEVVLCANRGIPYLDDAQVLVYEAIGALEAPLSALAYVC